VIEDVARQRKVSSRAVIEALPPQMLRLGAGSAFADTMQDIAQWGEVTLIVHTDDAIFEFTGAIPAGEIGRGYFNLMQRRACMDISGTSAAAASPSSSGRSWASNRPLSPSSTSTAASCSRCSSAATRLVR
jgi:hypothetical protein